MRRRLPTRPVPRALVCLGAAVVGLCAAVILLAVAQPSQQGAEDACAMRDRTQPAPGYQSRLPRVIHQQWKGDDVPLPPLMHHCQQVVRRVFPGHRHILWTDASQRALIASDYAWFLPIYDEFPRNIMRADAARTFILHRYGGLYMDLDYEPLVDFWDRLPDDAPAALESPYKINEHVLNALMSSPPRHAFWNRTWEHMAANRGYGQLMGPHTIETAAMESPIHVLRCEIWGRVSVPRPLLFGRYIQSAFRVYKNCGDPRDRRCLLGIHHSVVSYQFS
jgi:mannosyltransferase OCH1-like enzyme